MGLFDKKENEIVNLIYTNSDFPVRYKIEQKTLLTVNENTVNEVNVEIIWRIDRWDKNEKGYVISIFSEKHESSSPLGQMKSLLEFFSKFNEPTTHLLIQLNEKGEPIEILNQTEVFDKWLYLRDGELSDFKKIEETNLILTEGDKDFIDVLPIVLKSLYYVFFLTPVYGPKSSSNSKYKKLNLNSTLFEKNEVNINIGERIIDVSDLEVNIEHIGLGTIDNYGKIAKTYKDGYEKLVKVPLLYEFNYKADYLYGMDGRMIKCDAVVEEKASEKIISKQTFLITIIE